MTQVLRGLCIGLMIVLFGCGHRTAASDPSWVHEIKIADAVTPNLMRASLGEEVQWTNARPTSVRIGFLTTRLLDELACEKGVKTLLGQVKDLITIPAGESISLCFGRVGELKYNVWFEPENPRGPISPTATVRVETRG